MDLFTLNKEMLRQYFIQAFLFRVNTSRSRAALNIQVQHGAIQKRIALEYVDEVECLMQTVIWVR